MTKNDLSWLPEAAVQLLARRTPPDSTWVPQEEFLQQARRRVSPALIDATVMASMAPFEALANATVANPVPDVLIQASVEFLGRVPGGELITLVAPAWKAVIKLLQENHRALYEISPREMEMLVAAAYDAEGYDEVILTPRSGDGGKDVIAIKNGFYKIKIFDQVKALAPHREVDQEAVRAMLGLLHGNVNKGIVTTTAKFAPLVTEDEHIKPLLGYRLELCDGERFRERIRELATKG